MISFPVQKLISLIRAQLSIYLFFISIALGDWSKKTWMIYVRFIAYAWDFFPQLFS